MLLTHNFLYKYRILTSLHNFATASVKYKQISCSTSLFVFPKKFSGLSFEERTKRAKKTNEQRGSNAGSVCALERRLYIPKGWIMTAG